MVSVVGSLKFTIVSWASILSHLGVPLASFFFSLDTWILFFVKLERFPWASSYLFTDEIF